MAVTATDSRDRGQPSSWSASVDKICAGESVEDKRHLIILSAGNVPLESHINFPNSNLTDGIHDPGQSWNALTVGAYTEKTDINETQFRGWSSLAPAGDIAPGTTTSLIWLRGKWPIKPDIVLEGGNAAINSQKDQVDYPNSLLLLSTNRAIDAATFTWFADTSAASAKAAHLASHICAKYPEYWPETIRALIVHSTEWTARMREAYPCRTKTEKETLLRTCGFGVPDSGKALWSASNALTLIVQDALKAFNGNAMNEMHLHQIPWPVEVLQSLGETKVKCG